MKRFLFAGWLVAALSGYAGGPPAVKAVLFPFREAVIAARVDSVLMPYKVKIGEPFKRGAVLATLDDSRYAIEVKRASGQFDFAKAAHEDKKQLYEKKFTSDYELKRSEFDRHMAESTLGDARLNFSFCTIRAPFDGKLTEIQTREYETVRPGQPLFRIIDDNQLLAVMNVPMTAENLTTPGNKVSISIPGHEKVAVGKIYEVAPQADHRTGTVRVRVLIDNADGAFTAGMTGDLVHGK